jgi:hypothetical protein
VSRRQANQNFSPFAGLEFHADGMRSEARQPVRSVQTSCASQIVASGKLPMIRWTTCNERRRIRISCCGRGSGHGQCAPARRGRVLSGPPPRERSSFVSVDQVHVGSLNPAARSSSPVGLLRPAKADPYSPDIASAGIFYGRPSGTKRSHRQERRLCCRR